MSPPAPPAERPRAEMISSPLLFDVISLPLDVPAGWGTHGYALDRVTLGNGYSPAMARHPRAAHLGIAYRDGNVEGQIRVHVFLGQGGTSPRVLAVCAEIREMLTSPFAALTFLPQVPRAGNEINP